MNLFSLKKTFSLFFLIAIFIFFISQIVYSQNINKKLPHLSKQGTATQLTVDSEPFLILGSELGNSSFTSLEYMEPVWPKLKAMNLNTVLAPVYWELIDGFLIQRFELYHYE